MFGPGRIATLFLQAGQGEPMHTSLGTLAWLLRGAGASRSVSGRVAVDSETLGTAKGGMIAGKELIGRQKTRILFPGLPPKHCTNAVHAAVSAWWALPPVTLSWPWAERHGRGRP